MTAGSGIIKSFYRLIVIKKHLAIGFIYSLIRPLTGVDIVINLETGAVIYMGTILTISISLDLAVSIGTGAYCLCL